MEKLHKVNKTTLVIDHNHWCIFLCAASSNERWMICHYRQFRSHPIYRPACNSDHGIDSIHMKFDCTESLRKLQIYFRFSVELIQSAGLNLCFDLLTSVTNQNHCKTFFFGCFVFQVWLALPGFEIRTLNTFTSLIIRNIGRILSPRIC